MTFSLDEYKANINGHDISVNYSTVKKKLLEIAGWEKLLQNLTCKIAEENPVNNTEANVM